MNHLFISCSGDLYDTRISMSEPIRSKFSWHFLNIDTVSKLKACLRAGSFELGGYPLYFITSDGAALSFEAVRDNFRLVIDSIINEIDDGWRVVALDVNYEDCDLVCDHTYNSIPAAYGE